MCSHCLRASCDFLYRASGATRGKSVQRLCGDCTEIVQCQCSCRAVSAASARKSYGARAGIGLCTVPMQGLCNATYDMSTGYGLTIFFKYVKLLAKPNRRGRGARESVRKSHSLLLTEAARKEGYGLRRPIASQLWTRHKRCKLKFESFGNSRTKFIKPYKLLGSISIFNPCCMCCLKYQTWLSEVLWMWLQLFSEYWRRKKRSGILIVQYSGSVLYFVQFIGGQLYRWWFWIVK